MSNTIPGFQAAQDILNIYLNSMRNQGEVWNAAFGSMMSGSYEYKDLVRDFAKSYQLQQDAASAVLSYRPGGTLADEAPVWMHFYIEASQAKLGDFTISGKTRKFIGPNLDARGSSVKARCRSSSRPTASTSRASWSSSAPHRAHRAKRRCASFRAGTPSTTTWDDLGR